MTDRLMFPEVGSKWLVDGQEWEVASCKEAGDIQLVCLTRRDAYSIDTFPLPIALFWRMALEVSP